MVDKIEKSVADYYSEKIRMHGPCAKGVDWNGEHSQQLRFQQMARLFGTVRDLRGSIVSDLGCGYGAFFDYLTSNGFENFLYRGYDISKEMVSHANRRLEKTPSAEVALAKKIVSPTDFAVACGIFSVKLGQSDSVWLEYIHSILREMNDVCTRGFVFNCLTSYSDEGKKRDDLFYANPAKMFDFCMREFSRNVALLHNYELFEFTVLVQKK